MTAAELKAALATMSLVELKLARRWLEERIADLERFVTEMEAARLGHESSNDGDGQQKP